MIDDVIPTDGSLETARRVAVYLEQENARLLATIGMVRDIADEYASNASAAPSLLLYAKDVSKRIHNALAGE